MCVVSSLRTCVRFLCVIVLFSAVAALRPSKLRALRDGAANPGSSDCTPIQVHVGLGKTAQDMHISWRTADPSCPSQVLVKPGRGSDSLQGDAAAKLVYGYNFLLTERDMCAEPATSNTFSAQLHRVHISGLEPGSWYQYQVMGSDRSDTFRAAPVASPDYHTSFLAYGDLGDPVHVEAKSPGAAATIRSLQKELEQGDPDLVMHVGDIAYANGNPMIWDSFLDAISPITRRLPYMVAVGNHEYSWYDPRRGDTVNDPSGAQPYNPAWGNYGADAGGECGVMTARRFYMPRRRASDNPPFWYGFDHGSVHFTVMSTEHDVSKGSRQYEWLQQELSTVDRCVTPWLVVLMHRPMYVVYPHKSNREVGEHLRQSLEELFQQHRVDLTISGHVHSYYRTCVVADNSCLDDEQDEDNEQRQEQQQQQQLRTQAGKQPGVGARIATPTAAGGSNRNRTLTSRRLLSSTSRQRDDHGIVHFVIGSAGHKLSRIGEGQEDWCVDAQRTWGYGRFQVLSATQMRVQFVGSEEGEVLDEVLLEASKARQAVCARASTQ